MSKRGPSKHSPRFKENMRREAEKNEKKAPKSNCKFKTVRDVRKNEKG